MCLIISKFHPGNIEGYEATTEGEKKVSRFLKEAARPHNDFICWYDPPIGRSGKEPDFIHFGKAFGLLILKESERLDLTTNYFVQPLAVYHPRFRKKQ